MTLTKILKAASVAALAVMTVSCTDDIRQKDAKNFLFAVKAAAPVETKADVTEISESFDISMDGIKISLTATVTPNYENPFESCSTKGSMINSAEELDSFKMNIETVANAATVSKSTGEWALDETYLWPDDVPAQGLRFDSYVVDGATLGISDDEVSYSTSVVTSGASKDLLVGRTFASENLVPVTLYHPLTAVRFRVAGLVDGVSIKSMVVKNVAKSGKFTLPGTGTGALSLDDIAWTDLDNDADYEIDPIAEGGEEVIFVIPQAVAGTKLEVVFAQPNGKPDQTMEIDFPATGLGADGDWKAGYYYTYTISGGGFVAVENSGFDAQNNVTITNTGSLAAYVRAAVVCSWVDGAAYTGQWKGNFTPAEGWTLGRDGYYYHDEPVAVDEAVSLVGAFTEGAAPTGSPKSTLKKVVSVQIVADKSVWDN